MLKTNAIKASLLASTIALSLASCRKQAIHQVENPNSYMLEIVDNFTRSELNKPNTAGLEMFKIDTVEITQKNLEEPDVLAKKLNISAAV